MKRLKNGDISEQPLSIVRGLFKKMPTVVIVDDDEFLTKDIYQVLLERKGFRVLTAKDGSAGLDLLKKEVPSPDVVLVDCSMPQMNGETFLLNLKASLPQIFSESKVIGFTSYDPLSPTFKKIKSLAYDCREKPFDIDGIVEIVSDYLGMPVNDSSLAVGMK